MGPIAELDGVTAGYGRLAVAWDLNIAVEPGKVVVLLGPNGAGKSTLLRTMVGALRPLSGTVRWDGEATKEPLYRRSRRGLSFLPEGRAVSPSLSTADNLRLAGVPASGAVEMFPELRPLLKRRGGLLSGGEQQMLDVARALLRQPRAIFADELSFGLAPQIVDRLMASMRSAATDQGVAVLMIEQHIRHALAIADEVYVMRGGRIVLQGTGAEMRERIHEIELLYMATKDDEDEGSPESGDVKPRSA